MRNVPQRLKLSPEEEQFLRSWIRDEAHYQQGQGPAKRLQLLHQVRPADLSVLIAAAIPDPAEQLAAATQPPSETTPSWPWSEETFQTRMAEARKLLGLEQHGEPTASSP